SVAGVGTGVLAADSKKVAKYAINKMFKIKQIIIPGIKFKCAVFFRRFLTDALLAKITYKFQKKKNNS
ncbi:MAG: ketoacyl reductase, partial [Clostridia bacterium]|nr:ketoacyl reductase [Clostridia bacterium]